MKKMIIALIICFTIMFNLANSKPVITKDEHNNIIEIGQLAEKPKPCEIQTDHLLVKGIQFSSNGKYMDLIHFTDHTDQNFAILTNFYKLSDADMNHLMKLIHINQHYQVSYVNCHDDENSYFLERIHFI